MQDTSSPYGPAAGHHIRLGCVQQVRGLLFLFTYADKHLMCDEPQPHSILHPEASGTPRPSDPLSPETNRLIFIYLL